MPLNQTDNDQVFFKFVHGTDTTWQMAYSVDGTDTATASTVTVTPAAATDYILEIRINAARGATFLINGVVVGTSAALKDATDLIPYVGVLSATDSTAKACHMRAEWISRNYA